MKQEIRKALYDMGLSKLMGKITVGSRTMRVSHFVDDLANDLSEAGYTHADEYVCPTCEAGDMKDEGNVPRVINCKQCGAEPEACTCG